MKVDNALTKLCCDFEALWKDSIRFTVVEIRQFDNFSRWVEFHAPITYDNLKTFLRDDRVRRDPRRKLHITPSLFSVHTEARRPV
jgi:hypothetical protein